MEPSSRLVFRVRKIQSWFEWTSAHKLSPHKLHVGKENLLGLLVYKQATVLLGSELVSDAGCTPLVVLVLAEAACTSPGSVLVLAEDGCTGSVLVVAEAECGSTESVLVLADDPASPLLT